MPSLLQTVGSVVKLPAFTVAAGKTIMCFPGDLRDPEADYPFVKFSVVDRPQEPVFLPTPPGLTFSDQMAYSSIDLGLLAPAVHSGRVLAQGISDQFAGTGIGDAAGVTRALGGSVSAITGVMRDRWHSMNKAAAASILLRLPASAGIPFAGTAADVLDYSQKQVIAPNTSTTFQTSQIRSFSFSMKMVPREKKDSDVIRKIVSYFRENSYPEANDVIMKYPARWRIQFYSKGDQENPYVPKIHQCYLTGMTTSYNGTTNLFHEDGSPVEVDLTVNFQETRQLSRGDIQKLN